METRRLIAYLLVAALIAAVVAVRLLTVRARRRERRHASRPIQILVDEQEP
jgi:hypothetical protein